MFKTAFSFLVIISLSACVTETSYVDSKNQARVVTIDKNKAAEARLLLGLTQLQNNEFPKAKVNLLKAYEYAPQRADVNYSIAHYYEQVGETLLADQFYNQAVEIDPTNSNTLNNYAVFLCEQEQFEKAELLFLQAVSNIHFTEEAQTYKNMGLCALKNNRFEKALEHLRTASRHAPKNEMIWLHLAAVYYAMDNALAAENAFVQYTQLDKWSADGYVLGILLSGIDEQKQYYQERLIQYYPNSKQAYMVRAGAIDSSEFARLKQSYLTANQIDTGIAAFGNIQPLTKGSNVVDTAVDMEEPESLSSYEASDIKDKQVVERIQWLNIDNSDVKVPSYKVQDGDNLFRISVKFNIQIPTLQKWNNLKKASVFTGQKLYVKNPDIFYVVKQPQKLSNVAETLKIELKKLQQWNRVTQDGMVRAGTKIIKVDLEK